MKAKLNKLASFILIAALCCTFSGYSTFASTPPVAGEKSDNAGTLPDSDPSTTAEAQPDERLKADMIKLVADAKSDKMRPSLDPRIKPAQRNNLSKGAKIGIGIGIAAVVILIIVIVNGPRHSK